LVQTHIVRAEAIALMHGTATFPVEFEYVTGKLECTVKLTSTI